MDRKNNYGGHDFEVGSLTPKRRTQGKSPTCISSTVSLLHYSHRNRAFKPGADQNLKLGFIFPFFLPPFFSSSSFSFSSSSSPVMVEKCWGIGALEELTRQGEWDRWHRVTIETSHARESLLEPSWSRHWQAKLDRELPDETEPIASLLGPDIEIESPLPVSNGPTCSFSIFSIISVPAGCVSASSLRPNFP